MRFGVPCGVGIIQEISTFLWFSRMFAVWDFWFRFLVYCELRFVVFRVLGFPGFPRFCWFWFSGFWVMAILFCLVIGSLV